MGVIAPVTVIVYTNGTVIVNAFTVTGAISPVIILYTNESVRLTDARGALQVKLNCYLT